MPDSIIPDVATAMRPWTPPPGLSVAGGATFKRRRGATVRRRPAIGREGRKPDSVPAGRLSPARRDGHFSSRLAAGPRFPGGATNTRGARASHASPCSVLHRARFFVPPMSPSGRWALTPPFHPWSPGGGRYIFCDTVCRRRLSPPAPRLSAGAPLCGVRTFLPRRPRGYRGRPTHPRNTHFRIG